MRNRYSRRASRGGVLALALALVACGGGGDAPPDNPAPNQAPIARAGADQAVDGSFSNDPNGSIAEYHWTQTGGTAVVLTNADASGRVTFAPAADFSGTASFRYTVPGLLERLVAAAGEFIERLGSGDVPGALAVLQGAAGQVVAEAIGVIEGFIGGDDTGPDGVWLAGDMHVHDDHSSDGSAMRQTLGQGAPGNVSVADQITFARTQGLDFLPLTDHRTFDQHYDPQWTSDALLLITGEEANGRPHANVLGAMDMINQADNPGGAPEVRKLQQSIWDAHAQGAAWQTNHPDDGETRSVNPDGTGFVPNSYAFATGPDLAEMWNRGGLTRPKIAYAENRWNAGFRFGISGASDNHFRELWAIAGPGQPLTRAFASGKSTPALLEAFKAGRTTISLNNHAPVVTLTGDFDGDGTFETVGGDERILPAGRSATLRVTVTNGVGTRVLVYRTPGVTNGAPAFQTFTPTRPADTFDFPVTAEAGVPDDWYRVELRGPGEVDSLDYNKLLDGEPQGALDPNVADQLRAATSPIFISTTSLARPVSPELPADNGGAPEPVPALALFGSAADNAFAGFADLAEADGVVHAVAEVRSGGRSHVLYRARLANGTLTQPVDLSPDSGLARQPAIAAAGRHVWVAFQDQRTGELPHNPQVFLRHSADGGASWDDELQLSASAARAQRPDLALLDAATPVVAWEDNTGGAFDVYARIVGRDAAPVNLSAANKTVTPGNGVDSRSAYYPASISPKVAVRADGAIAVAWEDNRFDVDPGWTGHMVDLADPDQVAASVQEPGFIEQGTETDDWEILAATFDGSAWSAPVNVSNAPEQADRHATVAFAVDGVLHAAWDSKLARPAGPRLEIRASRRTGATWSAPQAIAKDASYSSQRPVLGTDAAGLSLFWMDGRSSDWRWRVRRADLAGSVWVDAGFVTGPGNGTWPSYGNGWLAFTSDRSATREQRKPHQVFLLPLPLPAVEPPADADGDGLPDPSDACPNEAGPSGTSGCPTPTDTDGDGVPDQADQCLYQPGEPGNGGCPVASLPLCLGDYCLADLGEQGRMLQDLVDQVYVALVGGAQPLPPQGVFRVGTGAADHTPKGRTCIGGGSINCGRAADPSADPQAVRDPLISKATAITGANGETYIIVTTTNIGYFLAYKAEQNGLNGIYDVRLRIAQATGVPSTNVTVVSDHSHNGPDTIGIWGGVSADYLKITADAVVKAAVQAWTSRRPALIKVAAVNQNGALVPGVRALDSSYDLPPGNDPARGNPYNEFRMLVADDAMTGGRILTFVNYAPHATVTNGDKFDGKYRLTGDWAAWMPQEAEALYGGMGLATLGALGSTDWNKGSGIAAKEHEARERLRRLMAAATARLQPVRGAGVQVESTFIREPLMQPVLLLNYKPGVDHNDSRLPSDGFDVRIDRSVLPPFLTGTMVGTYVSAARIGDVFISTFPGEPFGELDYALHDGRVQGARVQFLLGGANDFFGYMVKDLATYEQTARTGFHYLPGCTDESDEIETALGIRPAGEGACSDHWTLMVSPTIGSHIVCTLQDQADRLGFVTANRDAECPVLTALDGLAPPPESGDPAAMATLEARQRAVEQARQLAEQCRNTAAPGAVCDALAEGARQADTYLGAGPAPARGDGIARAGVAVKDASWHLGASAGQFSDTGVGIANGRGFDPYGHSTRKVGSDILGTRITTRALVVEGGNGERIAIASNDLYLPNDLLHRRTAQLLAEHDLLAAATGGVVTGITDANLATTSSHSHTSPFYSTPGWGTWIFQDVIDLRFYEYMARQMADAVIAAASTMKPVRMGGATVHANDIQAHTYGPKNGRDGTPAGQPRDYTTQSVTVVSFDDISGGTPKPLANWVIFGVHPEWVWGEEIVNGDITHAVMRMLDRETGATTVWSQRETGSSGPHKDNRVHDPALRREFQESNFAGYDRAARYLTDSIKRALAQLAANAPERPDQFAPYQAGFEVKSEAQRVAPPVTRPYPSVSNCNTDRVFEGDVGTPITGLPDCDYTLDEAIDPVTEPFWEALPVNPAELAEQLDDYVPIPTSYSGTTFTAVQETAAVHLQVFKLGTIAATMSPNEQFTSQALNLESRLDKVADNLWHGFDWACVAQLRGILPPDEDPKVRAHCDRQNARYPEIGVGIPGNLQDEDFPRARAQIHNDARGWELDPVYVVQSGDDSSVRTLGGEAEPDDITQIKGNFTHEEFTEHGYDLVVSVGMANDYWGYMAEYREYRAHSDAYRKALNALGPHGADFVATRLARMAANLNGANVALPFNPLDAAYQAESARAEAFARTMGELARAYTTAYDATLPPDGGAPGIVDQSWVEEGVTPVVKQPVKRFSAAVLKFVGGSNYTDMPNVRVERLVSGTPEDGVWETYGTQEGEVQLQLQFLPSLPVASLPDDIPEIGGSPVPFPDPTALALWRAGQFEWVWTASFEAFISELDNLGARPGITPAGTYRFVVDGRHRGLLGYPNAIPYHFESETFEVVPWDGITVEDLRIENDGRVSFVVGPVNTFTTFMNGAKTDRTVTRNPGYTVGPVDYPDSYEGGISWIRNERQLFAGEQQYCGRCTFRPWADRAELAVTSIPVTVRRGNGKTYTLAATLQGGRWITAEPIGKNETAQVAAHAIVDQYGERNGAPSATARREPKGPRDADGDGVPDPADQCPTEPGPASNQGCPEVPRDRDGDGVPDEDDAFPNDPSESVDSDGDRIGNNADPDDDNDGVADGSDRFPFDAAEWADTDNDGIGDNADACPAVAGTGADGCPAPLEHFVGSIHEHSGFSDGEVGTTPDDYFQAALREGLDFMASSEHSDNAMVPVTLNTDCLSFDFIDCLQLPPEGVQKWDETAAIADGRDQPGVFTAIRGFEWTSDRFGHINVFFSQNDLNAKSGTGYAVSMEDFWQWLALPPEQRGGADGLAVFNHPGREDQVHRGCVSEETPEEITENDPTGLFPAGIDECLSDHGWPGDPAYAWNGLEYRPEHDARVVGIEMYGKKKDYYDGDNGAPAEGWYAYALGKGWHVAPVGAEDEHGRDWAKPGHAKTVILATGNTRAALRAAMEQRRFYALARNNADLRIGYSANGLPMGSRIELPAGSSLTFTVNVSDLDAANGVAATQLQIVAPGRAPVTVAGRTHAFTATVTDTEQWRFVRVLDAQGNVLAVSAPIWFKAPAAPPPPGGFPLCAPVQEETYCISDLDEVLGVPVGSAIQEAVDTVYNTLGIDGGEPPPPSSSASVFGCATAQDPAQCEAAVSALATKLQGCRFDTLPEALAEAFDEFSEGPITDYAGGSGNCSYEAVHDVLGVGEAAVFLHGLIAQCAASPAAPACGAIRSVADRPDAVSVAVASLPIPRGRLEYTADGAATPSTKTVNGAIDDWMATGTRIGGTEIHEFGEHVYSDFLFDSFGADDGDDARRWATLALLGEVSSRTERIDALQQALGDQLDVPPPGGTGSDHYGDAVNRDDGTDLTEVRWAADEANLYFLARVSRLLDPAKLVVVILADTDAAVAGMTGLDAGLTTAKFDRAVVLRNGSARAINLATGDSAAVGTAVASAAGYDNALEASLPRDLLQRADGKLDVAVFTARMDGSRFVPANVAYRDDEPVTIFGERRQALALFAGNIDEFSREIVVADLVMGLTQTARPGFGYHERQFVSGANISNEADTENGRLQPYGVFVPSAPALNPAGQVRTTIWTHYRGGKAHSGAAWTPRLFWQLGEEQGNLVVSPRGRGTSTWYTTRAHQDFFEVFADVAGTKRLNQYAEENLPADHAFTHDGLFEVDPARVYISGYSMGGYATYLFSGLYPDLFAGGFAQSGAVTQGAWTGLGPDASYCVGPGAEFDGDPATVCFVEANDGRANAQLNYRILENTRHVPITIHHGTNDELALTPGAARMGQRLLELQYRYDATTFLGYEHFTQAIVDEWRDGAVFLNQHARPENPRTVTYRVVPALVEAVNEVQLKGWNGGQPFTFNPDGAYWVDGLVVRNAARVGDNFEPTASGQIDVTSDAIAAMEYVPVPRSGTYAHADTGSPGQSSAYASTPVFSPGNHSTSYVRHGLEWQDTLPLPVANRFSATLRNLSAATLDLARMDQRFDETIVGDIATDGATRLTLANVGADMTVCVDGAPAGTVAQGGDAVVDLADDAQVKLVPGPDCDAAEPPSTAESDLAYCYTHPSHPQCPMAPLLALLGDAQRHACVTRGLDDAACPLSAVLQPLQDNDPTGATRTLAGVLSDVVGCAAGLDSPFCRFSADDCEADPTGQACAVRGVLDAIYALNDRLGLPFTGPAGAGNGPCDLPAGDPEPGTQEWQQRDLVNVICAAQRLTDQYANPAFMVALSADSSPRTFTYNLLEQAADPTRPRLTLSQWVPGGRSTDPFRVDEDWAAVGRGRVTHVSFVAESGARLVGRVFRPPASAPPPYPAIVITTGSIQGYQEMYNWAAEGLAEAGYLVLSYDVQGQGRSETLPHDENALPSLSGQGVPFQQAYNFEQGTRDALRWLLSSAEAPYAAATPNSNGTELYNPHADEVDRSALGLAGHSLGASAVSLVGQEQACEPGTPRLLRRDCISAIVGWDSLSAPAGLALKAPGLSLTAEYFFNPTPALGEPNRESGLAAFNAFAAAGVDSMRVSLRSSTHLEWTYVPLILPASRYGERVSMFYTLAWLDRYVRDDASATGRLTATHFDASADASSIGAGTYDPVSGTNVPYRIAGRCVANHVSIYYRSTYALEGGAESEPDLRARGCATDRDGDGVADDSDAFPDDPAESADADADGLGDNADTDDDNDGVQEPGDNCPGLANPDQEDADADGTGDACDAVAPASNPPDYADLCESYGVAGSEPVCGALREAESQLRAGCGAAGGSAAVCTLAGGNLHALIDACYERTGSTPEELGETQRIAACRIADAVVTGAAAFCRQVSAATGEAQRPQLCALIGGRHVGEYEMQAYENGWVHKALRLQNRLGYDLPLVRTSVVATHNSFNATDDNTPPTLSGLDSNQLYTMTDQLRMGVRSLEIDVHWMPRRSVDGATLREPVVCHGTELVAPHVGCTSEKPLRQVLEELRPWLDANPHEAVVVYIEDNLRHAGDELDAPLSGDAYEAAGTVVDDVLGDIVWKPAATPGAGVCQDTGGTYGQSGSWLNVSRGEMVAAGKQLLLIADSCSDGAGPAWDAVMHWKHTGTNVLQNGSHADGASYPDQCLYSRAQYDRAFTRVWEDSTMLTASDVADFPDVDARDKDGPITPAIARELMRCGMHMPGLDQLAPADGRLEAMVWSWAPGEPSAEAGRDCAYLNGAGRLAAGACGAARPHACVGDDNPALWVLGAPGAATAAQCPAGTHYSVPANGYLNERLKEAAGGQEVWVNYRRQASAFEGWASDHDASGAGTPRGDGAAADPIANLAAAIEQFIENLGTTLENLAVAVVAYATELMESPQTAPAQLAAAADDALTEAGVVSTGNPWVRRRPLNISHRGGENDWPENTMFAYAESIRDAGSDMIEMDIYETADGELVVIHDDTVDRTTNGSGSVSSFTLAQLRQLDAAYWFAQDATKRYGTNHDRPAADYVYRGIATGDRAAPAGYGPEDFRIPTLREIFENHRFANVFINIELKPDPDSTGQYEAKLAALIREYGRQDDVIVASFLDHNSTLFKANAPEVSTSVPTVQAAIDKGAGGFLGYNDMTVPAEHPGVGATVGHKAFQVPMELSGLQVITEEYIADAHARGMAVHAWTINSRAQMVQLLNWCVDGIMSDNPLLLEEVLQSGEWSCPLDGEGAGL